MYNESVGDPLVSVIIPVYCASEEQEEFLREALESVANQTFRGFEVIIIDDASPRDISPVLSSVGHLPDLKVIRNAENLRHAESRNVGIRVARGEFVAFLDHDDTWAPEKLERQLETFLRHLDAGLVFCAVRTFGSHAHALKIDQSTIPRRPDFEYFMRHGNHIITASAVMVRRDLLHEIGLFDSRFSTSDDLDAWLKIVRRRPIIFMEQPLVGYRLHSSNVNYAVDRANDTRLLFAQYVDYFRKAPLAAKLRLLKPMARKVAGQVYFRLFARNRASRTKELRNGGQA